MPFIYFFKFALKKAIYITSILSVFFFHWCLKLEQRIIKDIINTLEQAPAT